MNKLDLQKKAVDIRKGIVSSVHSAKAGHPGGSLSAADIFTYLYFEELHVDPKNPKDENTKTIPVKASDMQHYKDRPDVILVCVKGYSLDGIYEFIRRIADDCDSNFKYLWNRS